MVQQLIFLVQKCTVRRSKVWWAVTNSAGNLLRNSSGVNNKTGFYDNDGTKRQKIIRIQEINKKSLFSIYSLPRQQLHLVSIPEVLRQLRHNCAPYHHFPLLDYVLQIDDKSLGEKRNKY